MYADNNKGPGADALSPEFIHDLIDFLKIIAEETRFRILRELFRSGELTVSELYHTLQISQPSASQHLKILKDSGILKYRRKGRMTFYAIDRKGIIARYGEMLRYLNTEFFKK
ncbi:MAG: metalloregulator ArsR/SmtB family transcription factor [bacterium]|jgi:ArsR family transcriptional regulator|nr:metalloregulator ArsR/SmtB family transcription factor [bacterium]